MADPDRIIVPDGGWIEPAYDTVYQCSNWTQVETVLSPDRLPTEETIEKLRVRFVPSEVKREEDSQSSSPLFPIYTKDASGNRVTPVVNSYFVWKEGAVIMANDIYGKVLRTARVDTVVPVYFIASIFQRNSPEDAHPRAGYLDGAGNETVYNSLCENMAWKTIADNEQSVWEASQA